MVKDKINIYYFLVSISIYFFYHILFQLHNFFNQLDNTDMVYKSLYLSKYYFKLS